MAVPRCDPGNGLAFGIRAQEPNPKPFWAFTAVALEEYDPNSNTTNIEALHPPMSELHEVARMPDGEAAPLVVDSAGMFLLLLRASGLLTMRMENVNYPMFVATLPGSRLS